MTIKVPYRGIIEIVGGHDTGKTLAALQTAYPYDSTVFVDDDMKGDGTVQQMKSSGVEIESYINLGIKRAKLGNQATAEDLLKLIVFPTVEEICKKQHEVIIWDTWRIVYSSARQFVERNKPLYKDVVDWKGTNEMIQGLVSKVARQIEQKQLNLLRSHCQLLIITHHLKDKYVKNVVVGDAPESSATFSEICNMRLWLRRNPISKAPIVLFLKRPNLPKVVNGEIEFLNIVPAKITPRADEKSIWQAMKRYEDEPFESREPREDETPTSEEYAAISNTLSPEQREYFLTVIKHQKEEAVESQNIAASLNQPAPNSGVMLLTRAMTDCGLNGDALSAELGISVSEIMSKNSDEIAALWGKLKDARIL